MITLDDFMPINAKRNKEDTKRQSNKIKGITRREITLKDLPYEIRRNPRNFIEKVKKQNLSDNQKALLEMIEKGLRIKLKNKQVINVEPYREYYLLLLYESLNTKKLKEENHGK
ncbi:MAG: hypothetical protein ACP5TX_04380 [Thermoplasmata archaeon]